MLSGAIYFREKNMKMVIHPKYSHVSAAHGHIFYKKYLTKGQKEPKAGLGRRKVFQKINERI